MMRWAGLVLGIVLAAFVVVKFGLGVSTYSIMTDAMAPGLNTGDVVAAAAYRFSDPQRGDVVVFRPARTIVFVRRIAAMPGDRVQMRHGRLFLNGAEVPRTGGAGGQFGESLMGRQYRVLEPAGQRPLDDTAATLVPAGSFFVLSDNRDGADDSRGALGLVPRSAIAGKALVKLFDARAGRGSLAAVQ